MLFFIYDGILGWKAKNYDGSSIEMGQLANWPDNTSTEILPADSPWRADLYDYMERITYNNPLNVVGPVVVDAYAPNANAINEEDKLYYVP